MENDDVTVAISERSAANLRGVRERQLTDHKFRYDRSDIISRAQLEKDRARLATWLAGVSAPIEKQFSKDDFLMEMSATKALDCFKDSAEGRGKKEQARVIALNKARAQQKEEERRSAEHLHHAETRMKHFFENASSMSTSMEEQPSIDIDHNESESVASGVYSVINELSKLEVVRDEALLRADEVATSFNEGNPFIQRADVFERMWVLVSHSNPSWKACCSIFSALKKKAIALHRQLASCKNCATVFFPFFPDDYHMHQSSSQFKGCVDSRSMGKDSEILAQTALVSLAKEAGAYKKEGEEEYIKLIRVVRGTRDNKGGTKYGRFELCENSHVESCESTSQVTFMSRNLAVGVLKLVIQLHFKVPVSSKLLRPELHGAGFADYFQRYRHFVPEFADETIFRCFLVEFGQHVRRADKFDRGFKLNSNWWSGRCISPVSTFADSGWMGVLVKLDKPGLVELAKSLANGTCRVLDDFCRYDTNEEFLSCPVDTNVDLKQYLEQMPEWVEAENEAVEKELLPALNPLCLSTHPDIVSVEMANKVSKSKLSKRAPDITEKQLKRLEQKRKCEQGRRKKANRGSI
jgi:hypothetical protein